MYKSATKQSMIIGHQFYIAAKKNSSSKKERMFFDCMFYSVVLKSFFVFFFFVKNSILGTSCSLFQTAQLYHLCHVLSTDSLTDGSIKGTKSSWWCSVLGLKQCPPSAYMTICKCSNTSSHPFLCSFNWLLTWGPSTSYISSGTPASGHVICLSCLCHWQKQQLRLCSPSEFAGGNGWHL